MDRIKLPGNAASSPAADALKRFWNMASISEDEGEVTLYGEILSQRPTDWWTGEPLPGLYITPEGFLEDLEEVKDKSKINIRINSTGGDLYTGIAIHNALKGLKGSKTVVVEGIAASAASVIMCAGDDVQVYPGSMVMIHCVAGLLWDYYTIADLERLIKDFDAAEKAIAEIYEVKTGTATEALRSMMNEETWMVGSEAVDKGFADTLLDESGPDMLMSADRKILLVAGVRHNIEAFEKMPGIPMAKGGGSYHLPAASVQRAPISRGRATASIGPEKLKEWEAAAEGLRQNEAKARQAAETLIEKSQAGTLNYSERNTLNTLLKHFGQTLPEDASDRQTLTNATMRKSASMARAGTETKAIKATAASKADDINQKETAEIDAVVRAYLATK